MRRKPVVLTRNNAQAMRCKFYDKNKSECTLLNPNEALICNMKWCTLYIPKDKGVKKVGK